MRHLWALVTALAISSSSAVADESAEKVKGVCIANAIMAFSKSVNEFNRREGLNLPTVATVMERRHLAEAFCLQRAGCLVADETSRDALGLEFEACLSDEEAKRWKAVKQAH
jgi:hypothetical protein